MAFRIFFLKKKVSFDILKKIRNNESSNQRDEYNLNLI